MKSFVFVSMFKEPIMGFLNSSLMKKAHDNNIIQTKIISLLEENGFNHHKIDDKPYGGGPGELMKIDIIAPILKKFQNSHKILLDPAGKVFDQNHAKRLLKYDEIVFVCGRYEGIDARVYNYVDEAISLGDFVLSNGDLAALAMCDSIARLIPGFLNKEISLKEESHENGRLEASNFTRPPVFEGFLVPKVFLSGDHKKIALERKIESIKKTIKLRPDLIDKYPLTKEEKKLL